SIERARRQIIPETARRGDILDARGNILATSRSLIVLGVDPQVLRKEDEAKWPELAQLIDMPYGQLARIFTTKTRRADSAAENEDASKLTIFSPTPAPDATQAANQKSDDTELDEAVDENGERAIRWAKLSESVTESTYAKIQALGIKGVYGNRVYRRAYPHKTLAAHVVGYVNKEGAAAAGIEAYADFYLRGRDGWREGERDGKGREVAQFRTREVPAADGYSVVLSIDAAVQHMVDEELDYIGQKFKPKKATIIVSDPQTGFILGLGNYPTFDLNSYNRVPRDQQAVMRNIAVADQYEPGSTFKIVAASAALNEGLVTPASRFDCSLTSIEYKGRVRGLPAEDHRFHEPLTVAQIISKSSNRGAAQLAMLMGEQKFYDYARAFGFGELSGFPVGGEIRGDLAPPEKWDGLTITRMPMGHAIAATPLQMHMAMSVVASGGLLLRPQVIRQVRDANGEVVYRYGTISKRRVITEQTARTMCQLLQSVTVEGTGKDAAILNYEVAGKTGTTQKIVDGRYSNRHHVASFVGFFPASRPQVAISVIVDDADASVAGGTAYGSSVAAPSFKHLGEQLIQYLDIKPVYSPATGGNLVMGGNRR
ncbi:MAG TPA: penicillin-binding protein 2, partial [Opitutus sp.]|nr:penicillin-binding protein 2 [Opitutus sp.]